MTMESFNCIICNKEYKYKRNLYRHYRVVKSHPTVPYEGSKRSGKLTNQEQKEHRRQAQAKYIKKKQLKIRKERNARRRLLYQARREAVFWYSDSEDYDSDEYL